MPRIVRRRHDSHGRGLAALVVTAVSILGLSGCGDGGDSDSAVTIAEARASAKERALTEAKADLQDKAAEFCGATATYITALDRYGDVLHETTTTVGDVSDAGTDLEEPREDALAGAEAAVEAHQAVLDAEQELAEARAALEEKTSPGSAAETTSATTSDAKPMAPVATVNRVEQAESEFGTAQEGITDETPLTEASQQFNAAAVSLEMAWLRLFADAGCLTDEQAVQAEAAVRAYTTALQQSLLDAGHYDGEVDGVYGPATVDAVVALQQAHGLPATGTLDKATAAALEDELAAKGGAIAEEAVASTAATQQTLKLAGYWNGPVDGEWTPELTEALKDFQTALEVEPTGTVDAATVTALHTAIAETQEAASASATATQTGTPDTSTATPSSPTTSTSP
jgi:murein L,D-transpeptidase YcbB/YkuD